MMSKRFDVNKLIHEGTPVMDNDFKRQSQDLTKLQPKQPIYPAPPKKPVPLQQLQPMHPISPRQEQSAEPITLNDTNADEPIAPVKKKRGKKILKFLLIVLLLAGLSAGAWYYYTSTQKVLDDKDAQIKSLSSELKKSQVANKKLSDKLVAQSASISDTTTATTTSAFTQTDKENIAAAISSGNTAALEQKLASSVTVVIAASEGLGARTPVQAISDLNYLNSAKQPWDFNLPAATIADYQTGDYAKYFPDGAVVGKSADGKVVSFSTTANNKITVIFMCADAALL